MTKYIIDGNILEETANKIKNIKKDGAKIKVRDIAEEIRQLSFDDPEDFFASSTGVGSSAAAGIYKSLKKIPWIKTFDNFKESVNGKFSGWGNLEEVPSITLTTQNSTSQMFYNCSALKKVGKITIPLAVDAYQMFYGCSSLEEVELDIQQTPTRVEGMFYNCSSLKRIKGLDGVKITNGGSLFYNCSSLEEIPNIDITELTNGGAMFYGCKNVTAMHEIPETITNASSMYGKTGITEIIDFPKDNITSCASMFNGCTGLTYAPALVFPNASSTDGLFSGCTSLTKIEGVEFGKETYYYTSLFYNCPLEEIGFIRRPLVQRTGHANGWTLFGGITLSTLKKIGEIDCRTMKDAVVWMENCTALEYIGSMNLEACTNAYAMLRGCKNLKEVGELYMPNIQEMGELFRSCSSLEKAPTIDLTNARILEEMFYGCTKLIEVTFTGDPKNVTDVSNMFYNVKTEGTLIYDGRYDYSKIINAIPSTWTAKSSYTPTECTELTIVADNVSARQTTTTIHWTAITNGINEITGIEENGVVITGVATSEPFEQNTSYDEIAIREISYTFMGITAVTTIEQNVWVDQYYEINLNNQWRLSQDINNPDSSLYDGVYESYSNRGINSTGASAFITIEGYENFKFYIRSYGESNCDYIMVGQLDAEITNSTSYTSSLIKAYSRSSTSGTAISNHTLVEFKNIDGNRHTIQIIYRKDGSVNSGTDSGYILIPYEQ